MEENTLLEKKIEGEVVFQGPLIRVEHWKAELVNGKHAFREIVCHNGAAVIAAVDAEGRVTLVSQYRIAMGRILLELPAGKRDTEEEDMLLCAKRELEEETGLLARSWVQLTTLDTSPGFLTERIGLYLATDLYQGTVHPDEDEFLHITKMPLAEAVALVMQGKITDAKTIAGLLMAKEYLQDR